MFFTLSAFTLGFVLVTGCSSNNDNDVEQTPVPQEEQEPEVTDEQQEPEQYLEDGQEPDSSDSKSLSKEEDLEAEISAEPGIEKVMVQVVEGDGNRINADITINDEQKLSADEVADTYSKVIKEKYPDYFVDIIVVKGDQQLTQKTYE